MRRLGAVLVFGVLLVGSVLGQASLGASARTQLLVPVGSKAANYTAGLGAVLDGLFTLQPVEWMTAGVDTGYALIPIDLAQDGLVGESSLGLVRGGIGVTAGLSLGSRLTVFAMGELGGYMGLLQGTARGQAPGMFVGGGAGAGLLLSPRWLLELSSAYEGYLGLYDGVSVSLGVTRRLRGPGGAGLPREDFLPDGPGAGPLDGYIRFGEVELDRVFPVLYKYYDTHPIGSAVVTNEGDRPVTDLEIRFALRQFMDLPKVSGRVDELAPGESAKMDLYALFTEDILSATEGAKVAGELSASYRVAGRSGTDSEVVTLNTYERNAMTWDDDRKVAAFVTARDDEVQRFGRNVASVADEAEVEALDRPLLLAIAVLAALDEHRCSYVVDPSSPYAELSRDRRAVDSVQFPRQTLQFRAGDCDDLSATYNALLESLGVETAFITVPGHIYTALKLDMTPGEAGRAFARPGDTIRRGEHVWIPVETTLLHRGFMAAWAEGARAWREHSREGEAALFTTREAWQQYEPVAFGVSDYQVDLPLREDLVFSFRSELDRLITREIAEQEERFLRRLERNPEDGRTLNRLGVLYARYGRHEEAWRRFDQAARHGAGAAALVNLGNLAFLREDLAGARASYAAALAESRDNSAALLGLARVEFAEEHYREAEEVHKRLVALDPALAERFSHLGSGETQSGRAADSARFGTAVLWQEESR